jgi:hypothetical protein
VSVPLVGKCGNFLQYQQPGQCTYAFRLDRRDGDRRDENEKHAEELHFSTSRFLSWAPNIRNRNSFMVDIIVIEGWEIPDLLRTASHDLNLSKILQNGR